MRLPRPTYANVMSTVAVFIALGGTSYAVTKLPKGSVGERELRKDAVTSEKVKDGTLRSTDLAPGVATAGPRGPRGAEGPAGPAGASSLAEVIVERRPGVIDIPAEANGTVTVVSLTLSPGSWSLDGQVRLDYAPSPATYTEWFDCDLQTSAGERLVRATNRIGNAGDHDGSTDTLPLTAATTFSVATQVQLTCRHSGATARPANASEAVLRATRVGSVTKR